MKHDRENARPSEGEVDALRRSEAKFRQLHETRIDAFASVSMDGRFQEFNELFQRMVGYTADELHALTYLDLTPESWHAFEAEIIEKQVLARGHSDLYQKEYRRRDGVVFPVELRTILIRDPIAHTPVGMWAVVRDITDRKQSEQALIENRQALADAQESLLALINSTSDLIWAVDPQTFGLIIFNDAFRDYFARRGIDIRQGMTPADLLPPDFAERWREFYRRALNDGPFVEQYVTASGLPVLLVSLNLVKRGETVSAISVFGKDITPHVTSQEALRRSERRFRTLIEDAPVAIRVSREYRTLYANRKYLSLYGYESAQELMGTPVVDQWAPGERDDLIRRTRDISSGLQSLEYEGTALRKDGTRFFAHAAIGSVPLPDGPAVIAYLTDMTERRKAAAALEQTEERFRHIAETVTDFIWEVDADGLYTYTSPAVETILGYSPNELVGRKHFYDLFVDDVRDELRTAAFQVFAARQPFRAFPNTNVSKDGRIVRLETSGVPLLDETGNLVGYRGADSDVTERWLNEQAMQDLIGRVINAQEAERSRLARELHDDFSQRLALLAIDIHMLMQSPEKVEALQRSLGALYEDVNALANDVHRISHDLHPARLEQLGLAPAVRGLCRDLSAAHSLEIRCDVHPLPASVSTAAALCLYRVTQEALQNVIKHSGASTVLVELTGGDGELRLMVEDDGCGFDVAAAQRGGSLGLASMRERVRSMRGRFAVTSVQDRGTRIEVHAPQGTDPGMGASPAV